MVSSNTLTAKPGANKTGHITDHSLDAPVNATVEQLLPFILALAWRMFPRYLFPPELWQDEVYELVQRASIKYWRNARKASIPYPRAYLRQTMFTLVADLVKECRHLADLPLDDYGEIDPGTVQIETSSSLLDPANVFSQQQAYSECLLKLTADVMNLPAGQARSMICHLKDTVDDLQALDAAFKLHGVDIDQVNWPTNKRELQSSRTLLNLAKKKLRLRWKR